MSASIRATIRDSVNEMRRFADVIFAFSLGNEIRSDIVRWHGPDAVQKFLHALFLEAKGAAPDTLVSYANYPPTEYLDLDFLGVPRIIATVVLHGPGGAVLIDPGPSSTLPALREHLQIAQSLASGAATGSSNPQK